MEVPEAAAEVFTSGCCGRRFIAAGITGIIGTRLGFAVADDLSWLLDRGSRHCCGFVCSECDVAGFKMTGAAGAVSAAVVVDFFFFFFFFLSDPASGNSSDTAPCLRLIEAHLLSSWSSVAPHPFATSASSCSNFCARARLMPPLILPPRANAEFTSE